MTISPHRTGRGLVAALATALLVALPFAHATSAARPTAKATLNIGVKNFAEEQIVADMYTLLLQRAGFNVVQHQIAETPALQAAMVKGSIDLYPEYTGTGLLVLNPTSTSIVTDPIKAFDQVSSGYQKKFHFTWLHQSPMNDTNGIAVTQATASKYHLATLADLAKVSKKLTFAEDPACRARMDCLEGISAAYGVKFKKVTDVSSGPLRYSGLKSGTYNVIEVFTTDPPINADHLVVLADSKGKVFPADHIAPIVRDPILKKYPIIRRTLNRVAQYITTPVMIDLNAKVILQNKDAMNVARAFLKSKGLLK